VVVDGVAQRWRGVAMRVFLFLLLQAQLMLGNRLCGFDSSGHTELLIWPGLGEVGEQTLPGAASVDDTGKVLVEKGLYEACSDNRGSIRIHARCRGRSFGREHSAPCTRGAAALLIRAWLRMAASIARPPPTVGQSARAVLAVLVCGRSCSLVCVHNPCRYRCGRVPYVWWNGVHQLNDYP